MLTTNLIPPIPWRFMMNETNFDGDTAAGRDVAGRDRLSYGNDVNIHFDRAANWDSEREELTDRQRIRDLETFVFGDRRGLTLGVIRQLRNLVIWLIVVSILLFIALVLLTILASMMLRMVP